MVDPFFTLPLLALVAMAALRQRPLLARFAVGWALAYLALGTGQGMRAESAARNLARERGHEPHRLTVKPSFGNVLVWKAIYETAGRYHVDALRLGWSARTYPGESLAKLDLERDVPWLEPASRQARDIERFRWFSDDYLARDRNDVLRIVDARYSMVPNEVDALWGIRLDPAGGTEDPVAFFHMRRPTPAQRSKLGAMLRGATVPSLR